MSLAEVSVELPAAPAGPTREEDDSLEALRAATASTGLLGRLLGGSTRDDPSSQLKRALRLVTRRQSALKKYGDVLLERLGKAWLDAGAPGQPGVKQTVEVQLDAERKQYDETFAALERRHGHVQDLLEDVGDRFTKDIAEAERELVQLEDTLMLVDLGLSRLKSEGMFRALDVLNELPDVYLAGIPRRNVTKLKAWAIELRGRIQLDQDEVELKRSHLRNAMLQSMRQGVSADTQVLEDVKSLEDTHKRNDASYRKFLRKVGRKLAPAAGEFANGDEAAGAVAAVRENLQAVGERLAELREIEQSLLDRS